MTADIKRNLLTIAIAAVTAALTALLPGVRCDVEPGALDHLIDTDTDATPEPDPDMGSGSSSSGGSST